MMHDTTVFAVHIRPGGTPYLQSMWSWSCSCGESGPLVWPSRQRVQLDAERHVHAQQPNPAPEPVHTPSFVDDEMGMSTWTCSCGMRDRPGGHIQASRANQAHTRHTLTQLLRWYAGQRSQRDHDRLAHAEFKNRFNRLSPEGQQHTVEKGLAELL